MNRKLRMRLKWVRLYEETGNAGLVCRRCGISRPTLRKWWRRYERRDQRFAELNDPLQSRGHIPKTRKVMAGM